MKFIALGKVAKIDRTVASDEECETLPYVGLEHIEKGAGHFAAEFEGKPETLLATKFKFTSKHVLYGKLRPYLNKVALPPFDGVCTTEILPILPAEDKLDRTYLWAFLLTPGFVEWASSNVSGANLPRLSPKLLATYRIPLLPVAEQKRIAAILSKADRLRRLRRYARELSDGYLGSVFLEMFGDPVSNPMGWETAKLVGLCEITRGASPRPIKDFLGGTIPWIKIGDATQGDDLYITSTKDHVTEEGAKKSVFLKSGSLVFANCGVSLGFARILKTDGCIHDGWLSLGDLDETRITPIFLLKTLNQMTPYLRSLAPEGTQPNLNTGIMKKLPIILPPLALQQNFAQIVQKYGRLRAQQQETERQAEHLFQSLLKRAFQGEI
jgi:type I restriction enzyme S subunit